MEIEQKVEGFVEYLDLIRERGPILQHDLRRLSRRPRRAHLWLQALERWGLVKRVLVGRYPGYIATTSGMDRPQAIREIGRRAIEPLRPRSTHEPSERLGSRARVKAESLIALEQLWTSSSGSRSSELRGQR